MVEIKETHWEAVQAKTFTKWYNDKLIKGGFNPINDIYKDLQDGVALGNLLKCLLDTDIKFNKKPFTRIQKVENLEILIKFIKKQGLSLINIGPEDIVDCNRKLILGLIWTLISKLSISELGTGDLSVKEELLRWCKEVTKNYKNVNIMDLSRSWQDGLGFNAIIHRFRPDLVPNFYDLKSDDRHANLEQAFDTAERKLQIPKLLDVEDVADVVRPDEKIMITYLSEYYQKFNQFEKDQICKNIINNILNKIEWSIQSRNFYEIKSRSFLNNKKLFDEKKNEMDILISKVIQLHNEMQNINGRLSNDYINIHTTFSEINLLHDYYNLKKYNPPSDISIDKISYQYFDVSSYLSNKLNLRTNSEINSVNLHNKKITFKDSEEKRFNNEIDNIKNSILSDATIKNKLSVSDNIYKNIQSTSFDNSVIDKDYKNIKDVIVQYTDFLNHLDNENIFRDNIIKKALTVFDRSGSQEISLKDFRNLVSKLGLFIDDEIVNAMDVKNGFINRDTFIESIKVLLMRTCDSVILMKALSNINNENVEINEKDHKNLLFYNGKNNNINVKKLVDEFIKN
ncbi:hypothetical protein P3W45_000504 [Vairimorpha bombi]|jgi:actinin alpha 1/4